MSILAMMLLFVALQPGILLTLPAVGRSIFMSGKMSVQAVFVHALVFAVVLHFLRRGGYFEGFSSSSATTRPCYLIYPQYAPPISAEANKKLLQFCPEFDKNKKQTPARLQKVIDFLDPNVKHKLYEYGKTFKNTSKMSQVEVSTLFKNRTAASNDLYYYTTSINYLVNKCKAAGGNCTSAMYSSSSSSDKISAGPSGSMRM
jgi:hypothetical protein